VSYATAIRKEAGVFCGSFLRKGGVFSYPDMLGEIKTKRTWKKFPAGDRAPRGPGLPCQTGQTSPLTTLAAARLQWWCSWLVLPREMSSSPPTFRGDSGLLHVEPSRPILPFYRTISGVRLYWVLEEPKGPKGPPGVQWSRLTFYSTSLIPKPIWKSMPRREGPILEEEEHRERAHLPGKGVWPITKGHRSFRAGHCTLLPRR